MTLFTNHMLAQAPANPLLNCIEQLEALHVLCGADAAELKAVFNNEEEFFKALSLLLVKALACVNQIQETTRTDEQIKLLSRAVLAANVLTFFSIAQSRSNQLLLKQLNREVQIK